MNNWIVRQEFNKGITCIFNVFYSDGKTFKTYRQAVDYLRKQRGWPAWDWEDGK